jgi:AraC-like DNA-binding protein
MSEQPGTVSVFVLRALCAALAAAGVDAVAFLVAQGLSPGVLEETDVRVPAPAAVRAFEAAAARTGDPWFAIHAAERIPLGAVGFLDYHVRSSATLGEALRRTIRYFVLINDRMEAALEVEGDEARLVQRHRGPATDVEPRQLAEFHFAMILSRGRRLVGGEWPLRAVGFAHAAPAAAREHERFFRAPVRFGLPADEIVFARALLDTPLPTADPALSAVLERYAEALVAKLPVVGSFLDDARRAVAELLRGGDPGLEATAARLGKSRRTLQRHLQEHGTSYQDLVDGVRRDLALRWLPDTRMAITEVAYLLGFSEPAPFHRAFKRWTGQTPAEYRRAQGGRTSLPPPPFAAGAQSST